MCEYSHTKHIIKQHPCPKIFVAPNELSKSNVGIPYEVRICEN